jgi:hypothetical protein
MFLSDMSSNKRLHFNGSYIPALKAEALQPDGNCQVCSPSGVLKRRRFHLTLVAR